METGPAANYIALSRPAAAGALRPGACCRPAGGTITGAGVSRGAAHAEQHLHRLHLKRGGQAAPTEHPGPLKLHSDHSTSGHPCPPPLPL